MKHFVATTANSIAVHVDLINSGAARDIARQPSLLTMIAKALSQTEVSDTSLELEYDMGHPIGYDFVVPTAGDAEVFYARIARDNVFTRFTKKGAPAATSVLSAVLRPATVGDGYDLHDMWVGRLRPARPGSADATKHSRQYWQHHAILFDSQPLHPKTVTRDCPY